MTTKQKLTGYDRFDHNGEKFPAPLFVYMPSDSVLRKYPPEQLAIGYSEGMNVTSEKTADDLSAELQHAHDELLEMFRKHGTLKFNEQGRLVPADDAQK